MRLRHRRTLALCAAAALALAAPAVAAAHGSGHDDHHGKGLRSVKRIVVIYEENHSFDNLYGGWEGVNGRANADAAHTTHPRLLPFSGIQVTSRLVRSSGEAAISSSAIGGRATASSRPTGTATPKPASCSRRTAEPSGVVPLPPRAAMDAQFARLAETLAVGRRLGRENQRTQHCQC
jgi:hypothetical protein